MVGLSRQTCEKLISFDFGLAFLRSGRVNQNSVDTSTPSESFRPHNSIRVGLRLAIHQVERLLLKTLEQNIFTVFENYQKSLIKSTSRAKRASFDF